MREEEQYGWWWWWWGGERVQRVAVWNQMTSTGDGGFVVIFTMNKNRG